MSEAKPRVRICCDSTCDLGEYAGEIKVVPLYVYLGEAQYRDGVDVDAFGLFDFVRNNGVLPKTAAVSAVDYYTAWKPLADDGCEIVHINISSKMSACHMNASLTAEEMGRKGEGRVYPVDSLSLSSGSGHLALLGAQLAEKGLSGKEIKDELDKAAGALDVSFVVETLEYLHKGGRCSSVEKLGANLLKLKPCIEVKGGEMSVGKKYRGGMDKALEDYVRDRLHGRGDVDTRRIFITHTHAAPEVVEHVRGLIPKYQPFAEILETKAGCTITSHCGRGTLGILFFKKY